MNKPKILPRRDPVLLCQGFATFSLNPTEILTFQYTIATDRGRVRALDMNDVSQVYDEAIFNLAQFTLLAGSQELLTDEPLNRYGYRNNLSFKQWQQTDVILNNAQTLSLRVDNNNGGSLALAQGQVLAFYTDKEHTAYRKAFKWGKGLGLKRRSYVIETPIIAMVPGQVIATLRGTIPRRNGNIIAVSLLMVNEFLRAIEMTLSINGITAIQEVNSTYFSRMNQREPWIFPVYIQPGATFELNIIGALTQALPRTGQAVVCFYFDN